MLYKFIKYWYLKLNYFTNYICFKTIESIAI